MKYFLIMLLVLGLAAICMTGCDNVIDVLEQPVTPTMDDPEAFTVAFVQAAVDTYKTQGRNATIDHYNDPQSIDEQWYVFITDENDIYVAHPTAPHFIGRNISEIDGIDDTLVGVEIAKATEEGRWTEYLWPNPETNKLENKRTWSIRYDGYVFASGYYEPWGPNPESLLTVSKDDPQTYARSLVLSAIARYEAEGKEATGTYYNDPARIDGQWYVFITDENDIFVSHPANMQLVGTDLKELIGLDGAALGVEIASATATGTWIEYEWPNPESNNIEQKRTWAIRHVGYLFGTGYYEPISSDDQ